MSIFDHASTVTTHDWHTAGEPFRIVTGVATDGASVAERRMAAITGEPDRLRRFLCLEPRGHDDMYGGFITPPDDDGADFGVLFWHKDGFSTACGHGTMALGAWAVATGRVRAPEDGRAVVTIDVPSGRVQAIVDRQAGRTTEVTFRSVASRVLARGLSLTTSRGHLVVDLIFGGAVYASVPASALGLQVAVGDLPELIRLGREIKWAMNAHPLAKIVPDHLSGVYGTILFDDLGETADGPYQRNVTIFADGEVDRSPCGSGTAARVALLHADGRLGPGQVLTHESIIGTQFRARVAAAENGAAIPEVSGRAHEIGRSEFRIDPDDPLREGFSLR